MKSAYTTALVIDNGSTFSPFDDMDCSGSLTNHGTLNAGAITLTLSGTSFDWNEHGTPSTYFKNVVTNHGNTVDMFDSHIRVSGDWTNNGTCNPGTSTVEFTGAGDSHVRGDHPTQAQFATLLDSKAGGGRLVMDNSVTVVTASDVIVSSGSEMDAGVSNLDITGDFTIHGIYNPGSGRVVMFGGHAQSLSSDNSSQSFHDLTIDNGSVVTMDMPECVVDNPVVNRPALVERRRTRTDDLARFGQHDAVGRRAGGRAQILG
jgi:hypothetical protein